MRKNQPIIVGSLVLLLALTLACESTTPGAVSPLATPYTPLAAEVAAVRAGALLPGTFPAQPGATLTPDPVLLETERGLYQALADARADAANLELQITLNAQQMAADAATATAQAALRHEQATATAIAATATADARREAAYWADATATAQWQATQDALVSSRELAEQEALIAVANATATAVISEAQRANVAHYATMTAVHEDTLLQRERAARRDKVAWGAYIGITITALLAILALITVWTSRRMPDGTVLVPGFLAALMGLSFVDARKSQRPVTSLWAIRQRTESPDLLGDPQAQEREAHRAYLVRMAEVAPRPAVQRRTQRRLGPTPTARGLPPVQIVNPTDLLQVNPLLLAAAREQWEQEG